MALAGGVAAATLAVRHPPAPTNPAVPASRPASVWDSVYTDSQTVRGDSLYKATCAKCHGDKLNGTPDGTPLAGPDFVTNWHGTTLDRLYDKIINEMPPANPGSMPRELGPDILAFILKSNGFPSGARPLSGNADSLKAIMFEKSRP